MDNSLAIWLPIVIIVAILAITIPLIIFVRKWEKKRDVTCAGCGKIFQRQQTKTSRKSESSMAGSMYNSNNGIGIFEGSSSDIEFYCFSCYDLRKQPVPPSPTK